MTLAVRHFPIDDHLSLLVLPRRHPVGQSIRIKKVPFTVVGVLEPKGQSPTGQDQDDVRPTSYVHREA